MTYPNSSWVNSQQNDAKSKVLCFRPLLPAPSGPPPPPMCNYDTFKVHRFALSAVADGNCLEDGGSTTGSVSLEDASSSSGSRLSSPRTPDAARLVEIPDEVTIPRAVMLFHRSLALGSPNATDSKGRGSISVTSVVSLVQGQTRRASTPKPKPMLVGPPPGLEHLGGAPAIVSPPPYTPASFRKELMATFKTMASDGNVAKGVRRIRAQCVPRERQASELADALTYVLEEPRGQARRTFVAFIAGLSAAFEKSECIEGFKCFFCNVYPDLKEDVPKLPKLVDIELLPTLRSVFSAHEVASFLPPALA